MSKNFKIILVAAALLVVALGALIYSRRNSTIEPVVNPVAAGPDIVQGMLTTTIPSASTSTGYGSVFTGRLPNELATTSTVTLRNSTDGKDVLVFAGSQQLAKLWPVSASRRNAIVGQIGRNIYVGQFPESYNGYMVYGTGAFQIAQVDIVNGKTKLLKGTADEFIFSLQEHSHGFVVMALLDYNNHKLHIASTDTSLDTAIALPVTFTQFGDMYFSADGKQLAFSAAFGIPGAERGAAFTTPIKNPQLTEAGETIKRDMYMHVVGWKGNSALDMSEKPGPLLGGF